MKTKQKTLRLPAVTCDELAREAKRTGLSEGQIIRDALEAAGMTVPEVKPGTPLRKEVDSGVQDRDMTIVHHATIVIRDYSDPTHGITGVGDFWMSRAVERAPYGAIVREPRRIRIEIPDGDLADVMMELCRNEMTQHSGWDVASRLPGGGKFQARLDTYGPSGKDRISMEVVVTDITPVSRGGAGAGKWLAVTMVDVGEVSNG